MEQLQGWIAIEYLIVAAVVLAVLFLLTLAFRALAGRGDGPESSRLAVSESLEVDKNRRLVLVRRDDVEHLVLIGGGQDVVVESAIRPGVARREDAPASARILPGDRLEPEREPAPATARRPQSGGRPVPLRTARPAAFGDAAAAQEPAERAEPRLEGLAPEEKSRKA
ncbi:MAG: hypothetical protein ACOC71_04825 [Hyphomicrobiales bacterium]